MKEFYTFRFPKTHEHFGLFAEFLPEQDEKDENNIEITLCASTYPHPLSEDLEEARDILAQLEKEDKDISLEIVKITQSVEEV